MKFKRSLPPRVLAPVLWLAIGTAACAAPVGTNDSLAASAADGEGLSGGLAERAGVADAASGRKTVDLLIELQPRTAGLQFNERARPSTQDPRIRPLVERADAIASSPNAAPQGGLFGAGATPMVQTRRASPAADADWKTSAGAGGAAVSRLGDGSFGRSTTAEVDARWLWLPQELVRYVRENRGLVAGAAAGVLILLWAGSVALSNGRR